MSFTIQWGLAKPDFKATGYHTDKNNDADLIDTKLGGGTFTNNSGGTIAASKAVYQTTGSADSSEIDKAQSDSLATLPCLGFTVASIDNGNTGTVQNRGVLAGFTGLDVGTIYYVDPDTAGEITPTRPDPSEYTQMVGVARSDTQLEIILGSVEKGRQDMEANRETLSGNKTVTTADAQIQSLDPNGSDRNVTLPAEADSAGLTYFVYNRSAASAEELNVKNDAAALIRIVAGGEVGIFLCDGTEWAGGVLSQLFL